MLKLGCLLLCSFLPVQETQDELEALKKQVDVVQINSRDSDAGRIVQSQVFHVDSNEPHPNRVELLGI